MLPGKPTSTLCNNPGQGGKPLSRGDYDCTEWKVPDKAELTQFTRPSLDLLDQFVQKLERDLTSCPTIQTVVAF